jgi:hypothetical protein
MRNLTTSIPARLVEEVPEFVSGWLAIFPAKRIKETRSWSWRDEEIGGEEVGVFSAVTTPVYVVSDLSAGPRIGSDFVGYLRPRVERTLDTQLRK